jgi:hypothetical protein
MYGAEQYIKQQIKKPFFSEMYYTVSVGAIATRTFTNQPVNLIYVQSLIICSLSKGPATAVVSFTDNYGRKIIEIDMGQTTAAAVQSINSSIYIPLNLFLKGNTVTILASAFPANTTVNFSVGYQTIQDLA